MVDFFYSHPTWLVGLIVIGVWTGVSLLGLVIFNKLVDVHMREKDTETVGLTYAIVAVVYAVLIGFIVVNVFESSSKGDEIATNEANLLSALKFDSLGLNDQTSALIRSGVNKYADMVVKTEWPSQQAGKMDDAIFEPGWTEVATMSETLASFQPTTLGQGVTKQAMLHVMDELVEARRNRIEAAGEHVPGVIWQILLLAGAIAVGYTYLFGAHSFKIHMAITGLIAATISLVFVLIIALDYPFRGEVSVSDEAFVSVRNVKTHSGSEAGTPPPATEAPKVEGPSAPKPAPEAAH